MRFGIGYDTHRFNEGDHVMIGGVKFLILRALRPIVMVMSYYMPSLTRCWELLVWVI